jgi:sulfide:quinone oxidoreductase
MSQPHQVIVAGAGPAAVEVLLALRDLVPDSVELELIAPDRDLVVRAYDVLAPFHEGREHRYPLARIAGDLDAELVRDAVAGVDAGAQAVALRSGGERRYDGLVIAVGARQLDSIAGAIRFRGAQDAAHLKALLLDSHAGRHRSVAFVVPTGHAWPLPVYELALHTSSWLAERAVRNVPLALVSPERRPLAVFGTRVSREVATLLDDHGIDFVSGHALRVDAGRLQLAGGIELEADLAIAIPRLAGPRVHGLPADDDGFVPVDEFGRVRGVERVFAAGDATSFPVKQGGLATQQADVIATLLAGELGAPVDARAFEPVLRAVLFGGRHIRYLQAALGERLDVTSRASVSPLWSESSKLVGRYLAPYLDGLDAAATEPEPDPATVRFARNGAT